MIVATAAPASKAAESRAFSAHLAKEKTEIYKEVSACLLVLPGASSMAPTPRDGACATLETKDTGAVGRSRALLRVIEMRLPEP